MLRNVYISAISNLWGVGDWDQLVYIRVEERVV
jgi:hypothetical protein